MKKLKLDPGRNDHLRVTFHDSCNPARAMGFFEEPRYIIRNVCNHFHEMPENTIREKTFCCGSGAGLGADENMEMRLRGGLPAGQCGQIRERKTRRKPAGLHLCHRPGHLPAADGILGPGVEVTGVHELVGNALVMKGEKKGDVGLRGEPLAGQEERKNV